MIEMDDLVKNNGDVRKLFIDFLSSEKFKKIVSVMQEQQLEIAEIDQNGHRAVIDLTNQVDIDSAEELEAARRRKYVVVSLIINRDSAKAISAHRIKHPDWWVFTQPPDTDYLLASCWVYAQNFYQDLDKFKETVQGILENLNVGLLHDYEAIPFPG